MTDLADLMRPWFADFAPGSFVGGRLVPGGGEAVAIDDPATGARLMTYAGADAGVVAEAAEAAARAQKVWAALTGAERGAAMARLAALIERDAEALARLEAANVGRPIRDARAEVRAAAKMLGYYAGWCDKLHGEVVPLPTSHLNYTRREPYGVVLQITPWNAPMITTCWQIAPALATATAPLLKPSELTPFSSLVVAKLAIEAGLPEGLFNVLAGGAEAGRAALDHPSVRMVVFVGSPEGGRAVAVAAAERTIPALLELGGKSANIVFDDADLARAAMGAQSAIFAASGQSCVAGSRLLVHRPVYERFLDALAEATGRLSLGAPLDESTEVGPIQNARQHARVRDLIATGREEGARLATGGAEDRPGFWVRPTLLADVAPGSTVFETEIFGPVLAATPFDDEDEAVALANATRFGLAAGVWTRDVSRAHRMAHALEAGTVWINAYRSISVMTPFGGYKGSGYGRSSGTDALTAYTQAKSVWVETAAEPAQPFGRPAPGL